MMERKEKGQILIILAIAMVALLSITALAIDGSMVYNDRRTDQSTADSAALAGAGAAAQILKDHHPTDFVCGGGEAKPLAYQATLAALQAAYDSALADDVTLTLQDTSAENYVHITCNPGNSGKKYLDVEVVVTSTVETTFARIISRESLTTKVKSVARVYPKQPFANGNALVSLSNSCGTNVGGIEFAGGSDVDVTDAGIFSNSCIKAQSSATSVIVINGNIQYLTTCTGCATADMEPDATQASEPLPKEILNSDDIPVCSASPFKNADYSTGVLEPGNYYGLSIPAKKTVVLKPGLYCLKGDLNNGSQSILKAERVTFSILEGDVSINQNDKGLTWLTAPDCETKDATCDVPPAVRGLLMYLDPAKPHSVTLNGGSTNLFEGTIYGPNTTFKINGNSATDSFKTQIIGSYIYISGSSMLKMNLNGAEMYWDDSSIDLIE